MSTRTLTWILGAAVCVASVAAVPARAQDLETRRAVWQALSVPDTTFQRVTNADHTVTFRVPADWERIGDKLAFTNGQGTTVDAYAEDVPSGVPVASFASALLTHVRDLPGAAESIQVRRTEMAGLDAREIVFSFTTSHAEALRRVVWATVAGHVAVTVIFTVPAARATADDAIFKAIVLSTMVDEFGERARAFDEARESAGLGAAPVQIAEAVSVSPSLSDPDPAVRARARERLKSVFATSPDGASDLLLSRDTLVRLAAVDAIAASGNAALEPLLTYALDDSSAIVAEHAAASVAGRPDAVSIAVASWGELNPARRVLRLALQMSAARRIELVGELLKEDRKPPRPVVAPPPAIKPPPAKKSQGPPPPPPPMVAGGVIGSNFVSVIDAWGSDQNERAAVALDVLRHIDKSAFPMPFERLLGRKSDPLTARALEVALERQEPIPSRLLVGLVRSPSKRVQSLAIAALGEWGSTADLAALGPAPGTDKKPGSPDAADDRSDARAKIAIRTRLAAATGATRDAIIQEGLSDKRLADWVWLRYVRPPASSGAVSTATSSRIGALGEQILPGNVMLYAAIPSPAAAVGRISDLLDGVHADSARDQATLALILAYLRESIANQVNAHDGEPVFSALGIDGTQPVVAASWIANGAPPESSYGRRSAILVRVTDREHFESGLAGAVRAFGDYESVAPAIAFVAHVFGLIPSAMPVAAALALSDLRKDSKLPDAVVSDYSIPRTYRGIPCTELVRRSQSDRAVVNVGRVIAAYVGDTAIITPDWRSLDEMLDRLDTQGPRLADSPLFARAAAAKGDAIYFASGAELAREGGATPDVASGVPGESGGATFGSAAWSHTYDVPLGDPDSLAHIRPLNTSELAAPRDLLPSTTVAYAIACIDAHEGFVDWVTPYLGETRVKALRAVWAGDLENDARFELGPECGVAVLGMPKTLDLTDAPWAVFLKLRTDAIAQRMRDGRLLNGVVAGDTQHVKVGDTELVVAVRNGFLVFASSGDALARLGSGASLASTDEYAELVRGAPTSNLLVLGGYGSRAALDSIEMGADDLTVQTVVASMRAITRAFRGESFYATRTPEGISARMTVSVARDGAFSVGELAQHKTSLTRGFASIEAQGIPISDQRNLSAVTIRIRPKAGASVEQIASAVANRGQRILAQDKDGIVLQIEPRRPGATAAVTLPVTGSEFAPFLGATHEIRTKDPTIVAQAREIAGDDHDALSVARKLADWTFKNLTWKRVDVADASDTLASREADCLEFSELYVSMARSLGLPARIVSGIVHSDGSFGGHAWVEVYVGAWIELDPTFGTGFVDATHVRDDSYSLISYAGLGLLDIEVVSATLPVAEFQHDPHALVARIVGEKPDERIALAAALDVRELADRALGDGAWAAMSTAERGRIVGARRRLLATLGRLMGTSDDETPPRLLDMTVSAGDAHALVLSAVDYEDHRYRLRLARDGDVWAITEFRDLDIGVDYVGETIDAVAESIKAERAGRKPRENVSLVIAAVQVAESDAHGALDLVDRALEGREHDPVLLTLRARCLANLKRGGEADALLRQTLSANPGFGPAAVTLADIIDRDKAAAGRRAEAYRAYVALEPADPWGHQELGVALDELNDARGAAEAYRAASLADPLSTDQAALYVSYVAEKVSAADALKALDDACGRGIDCKSLVQTVFVDMWYDDDMAEKAEALVAARPGVIDGNAQAMLYVARIRIDAGHPQEALGLLHRCIEMAPDNSEMWAELAGALCDAHNWREALAAADRAIAIDADYADAHYVRACSLARLGRAHDAITALASAIDLDDAYAEDAIDDDDFASLRDRADFKKLTTVREKTTGDAPAETAQPDPAAPK